MKEEKLTFKITGEDGKDIECEALFTFEGKETGKNYIVYTDINGKKSPNRLNLEEGNELYPDIVPFAVTTRGEVIPMGYPIYDTMYLSAQVRYRAEQKEGGASGEAPEIETKKSKSYTFTTTLPSALLWCDVLNPC